jgi:hypothetical protein
MRNDVSSLVVIIIRMKVHLRDRQLGCMAVGWGDIPRRSRVMGNARNIWANVADPPTRPINLVKPILVMLKTLEKCI